MLSLRIVFVVLLLAFAVGCASADCIALRPGAVWMERVAAGDLQRVILASTGKLVPIRAMTAKDANVIAVGFSPGRKMDLSQERLGDQGFVLKTLKDGRKTTLVAAGATPVATTYALYTLAETYGAGFYLGGDALPGDKKPFALPRLDVVNKPTLEVRGVLPWYNFFDSPTTWNAEDYRFLIDQLAKSKNNFLGFHSYDYEPFCAYTNKEGKVVAGAPLASTAQVVWGTVPMKTKEFAFGTDRYFTKEYFGADCSMGYKTPEEGISQAKRLLVNALWYAKWRGVKTCLGFEVSGDPTAPGELENLELRLKELVRTYPMLDYVWIWEPEAMGLHGVQPHPSRSDFGAYYRRWEKQFAYIGNDRRQTEAVRMGIYALAAHRILKREAPNLRMVLSAWGGDNHLKFTDFYPGLDKVLPKDIVFSALDNIVTSDTVSEGYGKLSKDREFWPIPWFEFDGDQWMPQPNTKHFFSNIRDSVKKGAKGMLGIHWRTRDLEESQAYISQFAWNPELGYEEFYRDYARRRFGDERAAKLLMDLQDLGYRWIGTWGQVECGTFSWPAAPEENVRKLKEVFKTDGIRSSEALDYLKATCDWALNFNNVAGLLQGGGEVRELLAKLKREDRTATADEASLLKVRFDLAAAWLSDGMDDYASRISNRGELGVLATINTKAVADLMAVRSAIAEALPRDGGFPTLQELPRGEAPPCAQVRSILRTTSALTGRPFRISAIAVPRSFMDGEASVLYRSPGGEWTAAPLRLANLGRIEGAIPANAVKEDVLEYYIRLKDGDKVLTWPKGAPGNVERVSVVPALRTGRTAAKPAPAVRLGAAAKALCRLGLMAVSVEWPENPELRAFRVMRQRQGETAWSDVGRTVDSWFEDRAVEAGLGYKYRVLDVDTGAVVAESASVAVPEPPLPAAPEFSAVPLRGRARLRIKAAGDEVAGYSIGRADTPDGLFVTVGTVGVGNGCVVDVEPGKTYYYQLRAVSLTGKLGPASKPVAVQALAPGLKPILALNFDGTDAVKSSDLVVEDGFPALWAGDGGFVQLPHSEDYNTGEDLGVEFWVKLKSTADMPVFVCHGAWNMDGFFVQLLGGHVRFCLGGVGTVDAGSIEAGKWTHVAATYEGSEMAVYIDGKRVGATTASGGITPASRPLYIGRYDQEGDGYRVNGHIAGFRLYTFAPTEEEIASHYRERK